VPRFLGIDYGSRRIGLATGDELGVATPLPALVEGETPDRRRALAELVRARRIDELVLGQPLNMDGSIGPKAREMAALAEELRAELGRPVHLVDERLTSHLVEQGMKQRELRAIRASGVIDSRAAAVILQDYLDQRYPPLLAPGPDEDAAR
jgi:putative holliday junction resolvase